MKAFFKYIKWVLCFLTILYAVYFVTLISNEELASVLNDSYNLYLIIQVIHVFLSLSVFFIIWSSTLYDKWNKIDQTLIVLFFSIIGLWIWYFMYYKKYNSYLNEKENE